MEPAQVHDLQYELEEASPFLASEEAKQGSTKKALRFGTRFFRQAILFSLILLLLICNIILYRQNRLLSVAANDHGFSECSRPTS